MPWLTVKSQKTEKLVIGRRRGEASVGLVGREAGFLPGKNPRTRLYFQKRHQRVASINRVLWMDEKEEEEEDRGRSPTGFLLSQGHRRQPILLRDEHVS